MQIHSEVRGNVGIITCEGKMLIGEGDEMLRQAVLGLVDDGICRIILDLSEAPYVDASGLAELVRSYTAASRAGGTVALLGLNRRLQDLLRITKLLTVFTTYEKTQKEKAVRELSEFSR